MNNITKLPRGIVIKPEVRFGQPTVAKTRITVADILGLIEAGYRIDEVPTQYPAVTKEQARQAVRYAARILGKEEILAINS